MKNLVVMLPGALLGLGLGLSMASHAQARPEHFQGKPAPTLDEAVANFSEYNDKLAVILARGELTQADMTEVHELTYTLENALAKIDGELQAMAAALEAVHVASEKLDAATVKSQGQTYLKSARQLVK